MVSSVSKSSGHILAIGPSNVQSLKLIEVSWKLAVSRTVSNYTDITLSHLICINQQSLIYVELAGIVLALPIAKYKVMIYYTIEPNLIWSQLNQHQAHFHWEIPTGQTKPNHTVLISWHLNDV